MARKVNPTIIRIPFIQSWPSLWHSDVNYFSILHQDAFIRKYFKTQFRRYRIEVFKCVTKRSFNSLFITVFLFNVNSRANLQFKPFLFLRSFKLFRPLFDTEARRFSLAMRRLTGLPNVSVCFRTIRYQKPNLMNIVQTASPTLLSNYFFRRYKKMNSYKYILKSFRKIFAVAHKFKSNLKGLSLRIAGPVRAPRTRRSQTIRKTFFGTTPISTFANLIAYSVKVRRLSEGVVSLKLWLFRRLKYPRLLNPLNLKATLQNIVARYRKIRKYPKVSWQGAVRFWRIYIPKMNKIYYKDWLRKRSGQKSPHIVYDKNQKYNLKYRRDRKAFALRFNNPPPNKKVAVKQKGRG